MVFLHGSGLSLKALKHLCIFGATHQAQGKRQFINYDLSGLKLARSGIILKLLKLLVLRLEGKINLRQLPFVIPTVFSFCFCNPKRQHCTMPSVIFIRCCKNSHFSLTSSLCWCSFLVTNYCLFRFKFVLSLLVSTFQGSWWCCKNIM